MRHEIEIQVGKTYYQLNHFTPSKALSLLVRLTKIIGAPLAAFFTADDTLAFEAVLPRVVEQLGLGLEETIVLATVKELCMDLKFKNEQGQWEHVEFDIHFMGQIGQLFKVLRAVLEFQYKDFFDGVGVKGSGLLPKAKAAHK